MERSRSAAPSSARTRSPKRTRAAPGSSGGNDALTAAALAAGHNLSAYDHVIFAWPQASSCGWAGLGYVPGTYTYNNGSFSLRVIAHELSHNLGIGHASSLTCTSGGTVVALSSTCTYSEYGDPFTVMGSGSTYHNDGEQLGEIGWLGAGELKTVVPDGGTYSLKPVLGSTPGSAMVLRIARGDGTWFFLDVRTTYGATFDTFAPGSPAVTGVMIRLSPDAGTPIHTPQNTKLIDTTPGTATFNDAPLAVGMTLDDPVSHIAITTMSVDASGATVRVSTTGGPTVPSAFSATAAGPNRGRSHVASGHGRNGRDQLHDPPRRCPAGDAAAASVSFQDTGVTASDGLPVLDHGHGRSSNIVSPSGDCRGDHAGRPAVRPEPAHGTVGLDRPPRHRRRPSR